MPVRFGLVLLFLAGAGERMGAQTRAVTLQELGFQSELLSGSDPCPTMIVRSRECVQYAESAQSDRLISRAPDHRYEGLAIGAVVGAVVGVIGGLAVCGQSDDPDTSCAGYAIGGGLIMGGLGGLTGLLIGAQFPKESEPEPAPRDSVSS